MDEKQTDRLIDTHWNDDWCEALEEFWDNTLFHESRLKLIIKRLRLAVVPIAILPFDEKYLYANYISLPTENSSFDILRNSKMLVDIKRPEEVDKGIPLAPGTYKSVCIETPYVWQNFMILQEDIETEEKKEIDYRFYEAEQKLVELKVKKISLKAKEHNEDDAIKGHYIIPLFFGTIPVYCLMFLTNTITPDIFNARYLRETFDMIARIGESILNDKFFSLLWVKYCEKYKEIYEPETDDRKALFDTLGNRLSGKHVHKGQFSSWIHSIPGHWVDVNDNLNKTTEEFKTEYTNIKDRLIQGEKWYIDQLKNLLDNNKIRQLFTDVHDIKYLADYKNTEEAKQIIDKLKGHLYLFNDAKKIIWFKEILNEFEKNIDYTDETDFIKLREAFYKLKTVLNKTDYKTEKSKERRKQISAGFIRLWPIINKIDEYMGCDNLVFQGKDDNINNKYNYAYMLDSEEDNEFDIFEFTKTFYRFVIAFNKDDPKTPNPCTIKQIKITVDGDAIDGQNMIINCVLSQKGFSIRETFKDTEGNTSKIYNKLATILKGKGITTNIFK